MSTLKDSNRFVPKDNLPRIDGETTFQEVYKQLSQTGQGGFLLVDEGDVETYVKAYNLAFAVVRRVEKEISRMTAWPPETREQFLAQRMQEISNTPIKQIIHDITRWILVPVEQTPVDVSVSEDPLRAQDHRVFNVQEDGDSIGWYLNHEPLFDTTTEKTVFICRNKHENPDTDHGTCYYCPAPITDADKK